MKIVFLRFIDGKNVRFKNKVIDMLVREIDESEAKHIYDSFEHINDIVSIKGRGIEFSYANDEARMIFSYEYKFISKQILEDLVNDINIESIILKAKDLFEESFEREIELECIERNIPFYFYNENEVQVGYGANSFVVNKDSKNSDYSKVEDCGYIPIISVTGSNGKTTTVKLIYNILLNLGYRCGMSSTGGVYINGELILEGDTTGYFSAKEVLKSKDVDVAVLECARGGLIKQGLAYKNSTVAIITSLSNDHVGMEGSKSIDDLAKVKSLVTQVVSDNGVVVARADDNIIKHIQYKENLILFDNSKTSYMKNFINDGFECFYVEEDFVIREYLDEKKKILNIKEIDFAFNGASKSNVRNVICAYIAVSAIHKNLYEIINAIKKVKCDQLLNFGRQNIINYNGAKFIIDYGHNDEAFKEVFDLAKNISDNGRIICIVTAPGDRTNTQIINLGKIAARNSDFIIVREMEDKRGRRNSEVANMILYGINKTRFKLENIKLIMNGTEGFNYAMSIVKNNDIVIYFVQDKEETLMAINRLKKENTEI